MNEQKKTIPDFFIYGGLVLVVVCYLGFFNWQRSTAKKAEVTLIKKTKFFVVFKFPDGRTVSRQKTDAPKMEIGTTACYFQTKWIGDGIEPGPCPEEGSKVK